MAARNTRAMLSPSVSGSAANGCRLDLRAMLPQVQGKHGVKVGILEGATHKPKKGGPVVKIAEYAMYNEYGTSRIPARPFMREAMDTYADKSWMPELADMICKDRLDPQTAMARLGQIMVADIRQTIEDSPAWAAPNADSTVMQKERAAGTPLINSGDMQRAINYALTVGESSSHTGSDSRS